MSPTSQVIDDSAHGFVEPAKPDRAEEHVPQSVIDLFEAALEFGEEVA